MEKIALILAIIIGFTFSNICCYTHKPEEIISSATIKNTNSETNSYGAYLAGRVAHIRHDLNTSADYYMKVIDKLPSDTILINQLYIMLTSQGRVDEAVKYAEWAEKNKDKSPFIKTVKSVYEAKHQNYQQAIAKADKSGNQFTANLINPMLNAWFYAGLNQYTQAIKSLEPLLQDRSFHNMYLFHAGAISDYMQQNTEADKYYSMLLNMNGLKLSNFPLQVIGNFYLRQNNMEKFNIAMNLAENPSETSTQEIISDMKNSSSPDPIIKSPLIGVADTLYGIAFIIKNQPGAEEVSVLFASLSSYANPDSDMPIMLIGNILTSKEMYKEANAYYLKIRPEQYSYHEAQSLIAQNYMHMEEYDKAEPMLLELLKKHPSADIYLNLGEIMRINKRYRDATIYYEKALKSLPYELYDQRWGILLALGAIYEETGPYEKAENYLRQALILNDDHVIKNYLGYSMLKNGKNIEEAFELIVEAYNQASDDGSIIDSLGWALYQLGFYEKAIPYLEKATNASPSEAVIYDHLGDAYWETGRKNEAIYQWTHAMGLKDSSNELNKDKVLKKINKGKKTHKPFSFDQEKIEDIMAQIDQ